MDVIDELASAERAESGEGSTEVSRGLAGGPNKEIGELKGSATVRELAEGSNKELFVAVGMITSVPGTHEASVNNK